MFCYAVGDIGTPTRVRKQLDLPVSVLMQPKSQDNAEVDSKMKEIMKMNGILSINGMVRHNRLFKLIIRNSYVYDVFRCDNR